MSGGGIGRLGELYGLSSATMAGLADIAGAAPPPAQPAPPAAPPATAPAADPYSLEAWQAAAAAEGYPGGVRPADAVPPPPNPDYKKPGPDDTPQGPEVDTFPTVKTQDASQPVGPGGSGGVGAIPARAVPAHWQPGSHAVSLQHGMRPEELEQGLYSRDVAAGHQLIAADKHLEAAQQKGMGDAIYAAAHATAAKEANDRIAQLNAQRDAYVTRERSKLDAALAATQKEIDPDALWKERGGGAKVAAAVMIALNQFAVMWRGRGTNTAMQLINESIDNNIKAQQANIANAKSALDQKQNLVARNLATFGDKERAILATKMAYLDQAAAQADAHRAKAGTAEAEAGYHDLIAKVNEHRANYADQFAQRTHTNATEQMNEHFVPPQVVGGGVPGQKGKEGLYVPTLGGYARDEKAAALLNKKGAMRMQIGENMRQINGLMEESKKLSAVGDYMRLKQIDSQIQSLVDDSLTKNTVLEEQGAMSAADKEVAATAKGLKGSGVLTSAGIPLPNSFLSRQQQNIKKAATNVMTQHRLDGEAYGVQKGTEQYVQGPAGPEPVRKLEGRNATPSKRTQAVDDLVQPTKGVAQPRK